MTKLLVLLSLLIPAVQGAVTTAGELIVLEGQSLKVPCHYEPQYASYVKYWCQGRTREFCSSLARTDDHRAANPAGDKVSISDNPVQLVFTVTMNNVTEDDSGWYMCGVEVGSGWTADVSTFVHLKVIHGLSVESNHVIGEVGSSITVGCTYSAKYRASVKKWCRSGDWSSCRLTDGEGSFEDSSVAISDDRIRTFRVTLKKLQLSDAAWYLCVAGQHQIGVHVEVTPRTTTTSQTSSIAPSQSPKHLSSPKTISQKQWKNVIWESLLVCLCLLLLVVAAVLAIKLRRQKRPRHQSLEKAILSDAGASVVFLNQEVAQVYGA